jgi:hypothetical protein
MRGDLDDPLARMARWDELRRRLDSAQARPEPAVRPDPEPPAQTPVQRAADPLVGSRPDSPAYSRPDSPVDSRPDSPVDELTAAVRQVVERRQDLSVTLIVQDAQSMSSVRVAWWGGELRVTVTEVESDEVPDEPPPAPEPESGRTAARLAELLRHNPSLLAD